MSKKNLDIAFNIFDRDGNGVISVKELKDVFYGAKELDTHTGNSNIWDQIMDEVDTNHDNVISYDEFYNAMIAVINQRSSVL